jgi:acetyl-CoA carboxylase biotin carboxyl carrier protein
MPDRPSDPSETPDVRTIRHLVRLMQRYDLTAIDLGEGPSRIRLRRRGAEAAPAPAAPAPAAVPPPPGPVVGVPAPPAPAPAAAEPLAGALIRSPMVGTFYASSSPEAPPFVTVGSAVRPETTVCIIEAMKVFTDIPAGVGGTIAEVLVKNGQPVEFDQPLFRVSEEK